MGEYLKQPISYPGGKVSLRKPVVRQKIKMHANNWHKFIINHRGTKPRGETNIFNTQTIVNKQVGQIQQSRNIGLAGVAEEIDATLALTE